MKTYLVTVKMQIQADDRLEAFCEAEKIINKVDVVAYTDDALELPEILDE